MGHALATVVDNNPRRLADWNLQMVLLDYPLAEFHAKFWGAEQAYDKMADDSTTEDTGINSRCCVRGVEDKISCRLHQNVRICPEILSLDDVSQYIYPEASGQRRTFLSLLYLVFYLQRNGKRYFRGEIAMSFSQ